MISAALALIFSCHTGKDLLVSSIDGTKVPFYLELTPLAPVRHVNWQLNGQKCQIDDRNRLLVAQSGRHTLKGTYHINGRKDSVSYVMDALPPDDLCLVEIRTSKGTMIARLASQTPRHADHFEQLVLQKYYDSLVFHRIIPGFVIQGGDAQTRNEKRSIYTDDELDPEFHPELCHYRGALAMARMPDNVNPDKRSSPDQFYIVHGTALDEERLAQLAADRGKEYKSYQREAYLKHGGAPQLDGEYTVFGELILGHAVLDSIALTPTVQGDLPEQPIFMTLRMVQ